MTCSTARDLLPLYVGGDLLESRLAETEAHLDSCAPCRAEYEALRRTRELVQEMSVPAIDLAAEQKIWDSIRKDLPVSRRTGVARPRLLSAARYAALWIGGVALGFAAYQGGSRLRGEPASVPVSVESLGDLSLQPNRVTFSDATFSPGERYVQVPERMVEEWNEIRELYYQLRKDYEDLRLRLAAPERDK
jgi:predicted anti-sigma-YlaC factor YlaD